MKAAPSDVTTWASEKVRYFAGLEAGEIAVIAELWCQEAQSASGIADLEAAGAFRRDAGEDEPPLPEDFCLVLAADRVVALEFEPVNPRHPLEVESSQIGAPIAEWARGSVQIESPGSTREGDGDGLALTLKIDETTIACCAVQPQRNPGSVRVTALLGLELPES